MSENHIDENIDLEEMIGETVKLKSFGEFTIRSRTDRNTYLLGYKNRTIELAEDQLKEEIIKDENLPSYAFANKRDAEHMAEINSLSDEEYGNGIFGLNETEKK